MRCCQVWQGFHTERFLKNWAKPASWILACLTRKPAWPSWACGLGIFVLILVIGYVDYLLGPHVSLRIFYVIPVAFAVAWLGWWPSVVGSALCVAVWLASDYYSGSDFLRYRSLWWNASLVFAMYLLIAAILRALIDLQRDLEERVRQRTVALESETVARIRLQREILKITERERSTIGHDLHDGLCQHLAGTALATQVLVERLAALNAELAEQAKGIVNLVEEGIAQTRTLANGLLLVSIEPDRLIAELEKLASTVTTVHGVPCQMTVRGTPAAPDQVAASNLFRIAQEAVRNALRHARPTRLEITLTGEGPGLTLAVSDNGPGLPRKRRSPGMGLRIMAHRAEIIHGELALESAAGGGTRVRCSIPARAA